MQTYLRNAIVCVIEEFGCTTERGILSGSLVPLTERDVCLPDRPVQRVIRTERPIAEKCRVSHLENKKMLTILREVMPLRAMLKVYSFPRLSS